MDAYCGAINDQVFHDQVFHFGAKNKILMHPFPHTLITPAGKAFIDTIPRVIMLRQVTRESGE
jgi:hypothetical protein